MKTPARVAIVLLASAIPLACSLITPVDDLLLKDSGADATEASAPDTGAPDTGVPDTGAPDSAVDSGPSCGTAGPTAGLLGYWPMDEGQGTVIRDCTQNHFDGTFVALDAGVWAQGRTGAAIHVGEVNEGCVDLGAPMPFETLAPFSISAWIRPDAYPGAGTNWYIIGKTVNPSMGGWRVALGNPSFVQFRGTGPTGTIDLGVDGGAAATWVHVAAVFRPGTAVEIYVNATMVNSDTTNIPMAFSASIGHLRIGCRGDGIAGVSFKGLIDDVRLYGAALAIGDIQALAK